MKYLVGVYSVTPGHDRHRLAGPDNRFYYPPLLLRTPVAANPRGTVNRSFHPRPLSGPAPAAPPKKLDSNASPCTDGQKTTLTIAALEETERSYREATTAFEYKECMAHLRSFLENLHKEACVLVHAKRRGVLPTSWGKAVAYLVQQNVLTKTEEAFVTSLYTLVSDTGVHPLVAEREYARLMRNMNIEYGLLFLTRMDKWLSQP